MKHLIAGAVLAVLCTMPGTVNASAQSGIEIYNKTNYCLWATAYSAGRIVHSEGFPGWVAAHSEGTYPIDLRGPGEEFRVRVEILSTNKCEPQNGQHPLLEDISTHVQGSRSFRVRVLGTKGRFSLERY